MPTILDPDDPDPPSLGEIAEGSLARQPEIIDFLEGFAAPYPFTASGGIVDDFAELFFALETQTRPVYSPAVLPVRPARAATSSSCTSSPTSGTATTCCASNRWQHIWLNEGFATYTEWLWLEREGLITAAGDLRHHHRDPGGRPEFWDVTTGEPGAGRPVRLRGGVRPRRA